MYLKLNAILNSTQVAVATGHGVYPSAPPYSPGTPGPEYPFGSGALAGETNQAYEGLRHALRLLRLDEAHEGQQAWNPLGEIIGPGDTVVLKPNFVREFRETRAGHEDCLITHGSLIRAVLDYVYIALQGQGRIVIADAPQNDADFDAIRKIAGLEAIQEFYRRHAGFYVEVYDLRPERARKTDGVIVGHERLPGDPAGYLKVDLGRHSMFAEVEHLCHRLYGSEYDTSEIRRHHTGGVHEYLISKTILEADCVIDLPKLKTHKKTGITVCLKNLVGMNGNKNWLPHHREGTPSQGGDQFADDGVIHRIEQRAMACVRMVFPLLGPLRGVMAKPLKAMGKGIFGDTNKGTIRSGNWYGNDTTWRMVLDLNRVLRYADKRGRLQDQPARRMFCVVDGIVGGEGDGPLDPTPKCAGVVLAGCSPLAVDLVCARLMGFDYQRLPLLNRGMESHALPLGEFSHDEIVCASDEGGFQGRLTEVAGLGMRFQPHFGWTNMVEQEPPVSPAR
jgi:uncharacterized protein (DUF362 family)